MTSDNALLEAREELKRRLAAGEYKTLVDVFLEWFDRGLRKITRRAEPLPAWYLTVNLVLLFNLIGLASIYAAGDAPGVRRGMESVSLGYGFGFLYTISVAILPIASTVILKQYIDKIVSFWRDNLLDKTESVTSLNVFRKWLEAVSNRWLHFLVITIGGTLGGLYLISRSPQWGFTGYSFTFSTILLNLFNWNIIYQLIMVLLLSTRLHRYDPKLFPSDPASSEIISQLSSLLGFVVYFVAVFAFLFTLTFALAGLFPNFGGSVVLFYWVPLVALFFVNQASLSSIIRRAKWKTLNAIQLKVEKLQESKDFGNQETMDATKRLMDYHDRVKATRNSALDLGAILGFVNSLLLPLLAFFLSNIDLVLKFFGRKP
jgi:hypothetical protein